MPYKPNETRDIYHGELLDVQEALARRSPPVPFPAGMIQILRWFAALPESEKTRILTTDPSPAEFYVVRQEPTRRE